MGFRPRASSENSEPTRVTALAAIWCALAAYMHYPAVATTCVLAAKLVLRCSGFAVISLVVSPPRMTPFLRVATCACRGAPRRMCGTHGQGAFVSEVDDFSGDRIDCAQVSSSG
jgi:hypothetical protein